MENKNVKEKKIPKFTRSIQRKPRLELANMEPNPFPAICETTDSRWIAHCLYTNFSLFQEG